MNEIIIPIDLTQEEKEILAIFSKRQFMLIFPPGILGLIFVFWGNLPFVSGATDFITRLIFFVIMLTITICLAFIKLEKYEQYLNEFLITKWKFSKSQKTYHQ